MFVDDFAFAVVVVVVIDERSERVHMEIRMQDKR